MVLPLQRIDDYCLDERRQNEPGEGHDGEGEDAERRAHDKGEQRTENQAHLMNKNKNIYAGSCR